MKKIKISIAIKIIIVLGLGLWSCDSMLAQNDSGNVNKTAIDSLEFIKASQFIESMRSNKDYYIGEGTVSIGNNIGSAYKEAKKGALEDLSSKIKVRVQSTIIKVVTNRSQNRNNSSSEQTDRTYESKTNFYTDLVLNDVEISQPFYDYPESGYLTVIVYLNKNSYKKRITKDLDAKKTLIKTSIKNGDQKYIQGYYVQAIKDWIEANNRLRQFFNGLPLQDNLGPDGSIQNVAEYINGKITFFFSGLRLNSLTDKYIYDAKGRLNTPVLIAANYKDENGVDHPVPGLPLKAGFVSGDGTILSGLKTGNYGQASLLVSYINPDNKSCLINIRVDTTQFTDLNLIKNVVIPSIRIPARKMQTIAFSVTFKNSGKIMSPDELANNIQSAILENGSATEQVSISNAQLTPSDIQQINQGHSDYFLQVYVYMLNSSTVGGYENMYVAPCSATVSMYELPTARLIGSKQIQTVKGYGTSASGAGWDAYHKLTNKILNASQEMLGKIK